MGYFRSALDLNRSAGRRGGESNTLANLANLRLDLGELRAALGDLDASLALDRVIGTPSGEAMVLTTRAAVYTHLGDLDAARADLARAQILNLEIDNRYGQTCTDAALADLYCAAGDPAAAERHARTALDVARDIGDRRAELTALVALGDALLRLDALPAAIARYEEAVRLGGTHDSQPGCNACVGLAEALLRAGDPDRSLANAAIAQRLASRAGYATLEGRALTAMAKVHLARGAAAEAADHARRAVRLHRRTGFRHAEVEARAVLTASQRDAVQVRGSGR
jgi:tetratricopeptide (TPR) repeat protein